MVLRALARAVAVLLARRVAVALLFLSLSLCRSLALLVAADLALLVAAVFAFRVAAILACVVAPRLAFRVAFASEPSERASLALAVARRLLALAWLVARPANIVAAFASGLADACCCGLAINITQEYADQQAGHQCYGSLAVHCESPVCDFGGLWIRRGRTGGP